MATRQSARTRSGASGSEVGATDPALPQKKRARHRLIGALVLCAVAAVVVPLLLESEPTRPVSELPIAIPSRDLPLPARAADAKAEPPVDPARGGAVARGTIEPPKPAADAAAADARAGATQSADGRAAESKTADAKIRDAKTADPKPTGAKTGESKPGDAKAADAKAGDVKTGDAKAGAAKAGAAKPLDAKAASGSEARKDEIEQLAEARLKGETVGRYLLQVGAYSAQAGADAAVGRVEALGMRPLTERIKTDRGVRIRVRVGPFPSREAAERARERLKAAGIEAAMIAP
jgi:DedD protein